MDPPSRAYKDKALLISDINQEGLIENAFSVHPFCHCVEVITKNTNPPPFPGTESMAQPYQILLDYKAFLNPDIVNDMFCETTRFISLSPIDTGNGLFIQRGVITFSLNEATYKRFGLTGKKYGNTHLVTITADQRDLLARIRPFEPIEGILISNEIGIYIDYLKKYTEIDNNVMTWASTHAFNFDVTTIGTDGWRDRMLQAIDDALLSRDSIAIHSDWSRMTVEGVVDLSLLQEWLNEVKNAAPTLILVWDMDDVIGSFIGKQRHAEGVGGGFEAIVCGNGAPVAVRYQICAFRE